MTDECFAENAEQECDRLLSEAIKIDNRNYEALQLMASFKISQNKKDEAIRYLQQSKDCWSFLEESPPFDFRVNCSKLFLELEQYETASEILEGLINENDSDSEIWFLLAFSLASIDPNEAKHALDKCCKLLSGTDDQEIISQVEELNSKITSSPLYNPNPGDDMDTD